MVSFIGVGFFFFFPTYGPSHLAEAGHLNHLLK